MTKEEEHVPKLPEPIQNALDLFGLEHNEQSWDKDKGQPGAFVRHIIRTEMEDKGKIPPKSDSSTG